MAKVKWANRITAEWWRCLSADTKTMEYWRKQAESAYRMEYEGIPHPGVWPKFMSRVNLAMWIHATLEEGGRGVPKGFTAPLAAPELFVVDCYSLAEQLVDEDLIERLESSGKMTTWAQYVAKKGKKKSKK